MLPKLPTAGPQTSVAMAELSSPRGTMSIPRRPPVSPRVDDSMPAPHPTDRTSRGALSSDSCWQKPLVAAKARKSEDAIADATVQEPKVLWQGLGF